MKQRVYLDWNASAPLCQGARAAVVAALDVAGNPSSVHGEGRAAKAIIEKARAQVSQALGAAGADIVFTAGATEATAMALAGRDLVCSGVEHDAVLAWADAQLGTDRGGRVSIVEPANSSVQLANGETGVVQDLPQGVAVSDLTQGFGKIPVAFDWLGCDMALVSAHKLRGPRGVGALVLKKGIDIVARTRGGGQEMGRRSGTENLIGIAGFGAAAEAATKDLADGIWDKVAELRDLLEAAMLDSARDSFIVGQSSRRLPNTSCIVTPGWKGETQVMAMDLAGFAVSAGSACSSGKVKPSTVLRAMGFDDAQARCAIRVSLGPDNTEEDILRFAQAWTQAQRRYRAKTA